MPIVCVDKSDTAKAEVENAVVKEGVLEPPFEFEFELEVEG